MGDDQWRPEDNSDQQVWQGFSKKMDLPQMTHFSLNAAIDQFFDFPVPGLERQRRELHFSYSIIFEASKAIWLDVYRILQLSVCSRFRQELYNAFQSRPEYAGGFLQRSCCVLPVLLHGPIRHRE